MKSLTLQLGAPIYRVKMVRLSILIAAIMACAAAASAGSEARLSRPGDGACASIGLDDEEPLEVSLLELTSIDYKPGKALPSDIQDLDEETIVIEGYMAIDAGEGQPKFRLVWDSCGCGTTKVHHFVEVTLPEGDLTEYTPELLRVTGKLSVGEEKDDNGLVETLYRLKATKVEEVEDE